MQNHNLWAPWRMDYIRQLDKPAPAGKGETCFLCEASAAAAGSEDARQKLVLVHEARGLIVLNRYPYTSGHLLIAPHGHLGDLPELTAEVRAGLMELAVLGQDILRIAYNPQGFNLGVNLGRCAGAGLPGHLHMHLVPRWNGDTNFTGVIGGVRVIPQGLDHAYEELAKATAKVMKT